MIELTSTAQKHLDQYLGELRISLSACRSVDTHDVERDVIEHIEKSLSDTPTPVDVPALRGVLWELGSPSQWIPEEELPWRRRLRLRFRRALAQLSSGPEDFRLAYLSIGSLALAGLLVSFDAVAAFPLLCVALSFLFARAALATAGGPERLGGQRWLLYPALLLVYGAILIALLAWPALLAVVLADMLDDTNLHRELDPDFGRIPPPVLAAYAATAVGAVWCFLLGLLTWWRPGLVRSTFYPLANGFRRWHGMMLGLAGLVLLVAAVFAGPLLDEF